jgi:sulfopyruvate decarboxylase alpha subunit
LPDWQNAVFDALLAARVAQVAYVPDAGHARLIQRAHGEREMRAIPLTTEEEGIALLAGAWLGGARGVLLMQSSGVGNCLNLLAFARTCRFPLLTLVTMRGEYGERNPWQVPMGRATADAFRLMDVGVLRADSPDEAAPAVEHACLLAFEAGAMQAVLLGQRLIGAKPFAR